MVLSYAECFFITIKRYLYFFYVIQYSVVALVINCWMDGQTDIEEWAGQNYKLTIIAKQQMFEKMKKKQKNKKNKNLKKAKKGPM